MRLPPCDHTAAQISSWVTATFGAATVDGTTVYDLPAPRARPQARFMDSWEEGPSRFECPTPTMGP